MTATPGELRQPLLRGIEKAVLQVVEEIQKTSTARQGLKQSQAPQGNACPSARNDPHKTG
jgi:hypothetical protein